VGVLAGRTDHIDTRTPPAPSAATVAAEAPGRCGRAVATGESGEGSTVTSVEYERIFEFEQVFNFRDLGGYHTADGRQVRWRRIFRSAEPHRMTPQEAERVRSELALRTVIDFRAVEEASHPRGLGPLVAPPVERIHFPMGNARSKYEAREAGAWEPDFVSLLEGHANDWAEAVRVLAREETYPALFHCVTGKDRTGVLATLVLDVLGVDDETIIQDYSLSQQAMDMLIARLRSRGVIAADEPPNPALGVSPAAMRTLVDLLNERYDGARGFLKAHGVEPRVFDALGDLLLEEVKE
jgi:protein-tyrosine phosphatase